MRLGPVTEARWRTWPRSRGIESAWASESSTYWPRRPRGKSGRRNLQRRGRIASGIRPRSLRWLQRRCGALCDGLEITPDTIEPTITPDQTNYRWVQLWGSANCAHQTFVISGDKIVLSGYESKPALLRPAIPIENEPPSVPVPAAAQQAGQTGYGTLLNNRVAVKLGNRESLSQNCRQ